MVVESRLVHFVLAVHLELVAAQRPEHLVLGQPSEHLASGEGLDVPEDVGVDPGVQLLQSVHVGQMMHLQNVALVQPGEEEITAEADDDLEL